MTEILATNITSPIGLTTLQNYDSVKNGGTALKPQSGWRGVPGQVCVASFSDDQKKDLLLDGFTWFESLAIRSVREALSHARIDVKSSRTAFILSTTKADVDELAATPDKDGAYLSPGRAAEKIALAIGVTTKPVVVCNACISGVTAQLLADRLISDGVFDEAIVCGADTLSKFTVAGFSSFKSLSPTFCRPFDIERLGLNLGEAAATVILGRDASSSDRWKIVSGHLDNDAYHVSAPAPDGSGVKRAIDNTVPVDRRERLASVCAHGTATMFNDQMESKAIAAAGLSEIPVTAYKGVFGHTLGASGILESVITMCALEDGTVLPVKGFEEIGVSGRIDISCKSRTAVSEEFLKIISGFGGCNGAILYSKAAEKSAIPCGTNDYSVAGTVKITPDSVELDGEAIPVSTSGQAMLTEVFKSRLSGDQKYYKMDAFSRLVFVAAGLLVKDRLDGCAPESTSVVVFNGSSSIVADREHLGTFADPDGFYPSPSVFLYTLPNVVLGEIAIKYNIKGETTFLILPEKDEARMDSIVDSTISNTAPDALLCGWADCSDAGVFEAEFKLIKHK